MGGGNVTPCSSSQDHADRGLGDSLGVGDLPARLSRSFHSPDVEYVGFGQLDHSVSFAGSMAPMVGAVLEPVTITARHTPGLAGVLHVSVRVSGCQVTWSDASPDVAPVLDLGVVTRTVRPFVRHDVGTAVRAVHPELPVSAATEKGSRPKPTRTPFGAACGDRPVLVDLCPEAALRIGAGKSATPRTEAIRPGATLLEWERRTALLTRKNVDGTLLSRHRNYSSGVSRLRMVARRGGFAVPNCSMPPGGTAMNQEVA